MWRLQNDDAQTSRSSAGAKAESDEAIFTEVSMDVRPEEKPGAPWMTRK